MAATVRLATRVDVPLINAMVYELAEVEGNVSSCKATDAKLNELLFRHAPFQGPTVFMLEVDEPKKGRKEEEAMSGTVVTKPMPETSGQEPPVKASEEGVLESTASVELMLFRSVSNVKYKGRFFSEVSSPKSSDFLSQVSSPKSSPLRTNVQTDMEEPVLEVFRSRSDVNLKERDASVTTTAASDDAKPPPEPPRQEDPGSEDLFEETIGEFAALRLVEDPASEVFRSPCGNASRVVVGYAHVFPNFSTYLSKPGLYREAFYIREPYRKLGLGKTFLKKIAREAVKLGMERMEWSVLHSNDPAIQFYQGMGAVIKPGFRKCAIDGPALANCEP
jgi:GNAT superfamily N-acetyltransferase